MGDHVEKSSVVRSLSIRVRLMVAFAGLTLLLAGMAGVGAWRLAELDRRTSDMARVSVRVERVAAEWLAQSRTNLLRRLVVTRSEDAALNKMLAPELAAATKKINDLQDEVEALTRTAEAQALVKEADVKRTAFLAARKEVADMKQAGDSAGANALLDTKMVPAQDAYLASIEAVRDYYVAKVGHDADAAAQSASSGRKFLVSFCVAGVLLALLSSWLIARSVTQPIDDALRAARRVADGDLTVNLQATGRDEMAQLLRALDEMATRLRTLVSEVAQRARTVAETSAQIAHGNSDLSQRTEEQASTLEETASSMEELTSTVTQNAENARAANELAAGAAAVAREGGNAVGQVVSTMNGISASSKRIAEIISVIDGIAFQTNILALNAAVEAARAGDQGRGFAVVAAEVRTLAQRSAHAAKEIKGLIVDSVSQVDAGTRQVDIAGRKMEDIVAAVTRVSSLIAEIASASQEQSSGIEQINTAVTQMDQAVQQNASLVEEAAAATESMKSDAQALLAQVGRFTVGEAQEAAPASTAATAITFLRQGSPAPDVRDVPRLATAPASQSAPAAGWREF